MQDCIFNPPDCRAAEDILVELQIEERRTAERTRALSETIAALRRTETELSQELHELSVLLTLAQACPGKRPLERPQQGIVAQPQGQISPSITALFVPPPCQHEVDRATRHSKSCDAVPMGGRGARVFQDLCAPMHMAPLIMIA